MKLLIILIVFVNLSSHYVVESAKILGVFHMPAFSHQQLGNVLLKELARKGHEVTMITSVEPKEPMKNMKIVKISMEKFEERHKDDEQFNFFDVAGSSAVAQVFWLDFIGITITELALEDANVQNLLKSDAKFDVVIIENFLNEAFKGFCYHYGAPCVSLSTIGPTRWTNPQMGNPSPPSYVPDLYLTYSERMNFWERLHNSAIYVGAELLRHLYTFPKHNQILHKYFPGAPHLLDLYYNTSLTLLNADASTNSPVPLVPNMINIGGYHVAPPKKLPEDLQQFLDNAADGVIYFSMGSNLKSMDMPDEKRKAILKVFSQLKQKVLWKFEDESLEGQPENLKISSWLPQRDILAHPNITLFITHGGLLSLIEAIYHGIPIVAVPIFGDQELNVANAEISGYAIGVPYKKLNEKSLGDAINKILNDPRYSENAKSRSKIMHDQPMKPLDRAVFWVEYVIRHRGAPHLRTAALNLSWYQYLLLDVLAVVMLTISVIVYISYRLIKKLFSKKNKQSKTKDKTKKMN